MNEPSPHPYNAERFREDLVDQVGAIIEAFERGGKPERPANLKNLQAGSLSSRISKGSDTLLIWECAEASGDIYFKLDLATGAAVFTENARSLWSLQNLDWLSFHENVHESDRRALDTALQRCRDGQADRVSRTLRILSLDGEYQAYQLRATRPHSGARHQLRGQIAALQDNAPENRSAPEEAVHRCSLLLVRRPSSNYEAIVTTPKLAAILGSPDASPKQLADAFFSSIAPEQLDRVLDALNDAPDDQPIPLGLALASNDNGSTGGLWEISAIERTSPSSWKVNLALRSLSPGLFRKSLERSETATLFAYHNGVPCFANHAFERDSGYADADELARRGGLPQLFADPGTLPEIGRALSAGREWQGEISILSGDGTPRTFGARALALDPGPGAEATFALYLKPVFPVHSLTPALLWEKVANHAPLAIWFTTPQGEYPVMNRYFSSRISWLTPCRSATEDEILVSRSGDESAIEASAPIRTEETFTFIDGRQHVLQVAKLPLKDSAGENLGVLNLGIDITAARAAQNEAEDAKAETAVLNEQLEQALSIASEAGAIAEQANLSKGAFLATISHEIRTPLNGVLGMATLLMDTPLDLDQKEFVSTIESSGESLLGLINDILDFTTLEGGHIEVDHDRFNVRDTIESAIETIAPNAADKKIEITSWIHPAIPETVLGDREKLSKILVKLLHNAVKFSESGTVSLRCSRESSNPAVILFEVEDQGIGIPPERLDRLFSPFSQVDASNTRRYGGSGLSLAICKRLASFLGGSIKAESQVGKGSLFRLQIKLAPETERESTASETSPILFGKRVLVADHHRDLKVSLIQHLEALGCAVALASNWREAAKRIEAGEAYDLICVSDKNARDVGYQFFSPNSELTTPPVVIRQSPGQNEMRLPWANYLASPFKAAALRATFESALAYDEPAIDIDLTEIDESLMAKRYPLKILLAEDSRVNQKVAELMTEKLGYQMLTVENGKHALAAVSQGDYDVVLMDIQMPEMDGLEATRKIRELAALAAQPYIIAVTANAMQGDRERAIESGMNDYIAKPLKRELLIDKLIDAYHAMQSRI